MEELFKEVVQSLNTMNEHLEIMASIFGKTNWIQVTITSVLAIVASLLGSKLGAEYVLKNEKNKYQWDCYIEYYKIITQFLSDINSIIKTICDLKELQKHILPECSTEFNWKDFNSIANCVNEVSEKIQNLKVDESIEPMRFKHKQLYITKSYEILYYDKFSDVCTKYQVKAASYYPIITESLSHKSELLLEKIEDATNHSMKQFDICAFKNDLISYSKEVKKKIDSFKIKTNKE